MMYTKSKLTSTIRKIDPPPRVPAAEDGPTGVDPAHTRSVCTSTEYSQLLPPTLLACNVPRSPALLSHKKLKVLVYFSDSLSEQDSVLVNDASNPFVVFVFTAVLHVP